MNHAAVKKVLRMVLRFINARKKTQQKQKQKQKNPSNNNKTPHAMIWDESWLVAQKI